MPRLRAVFPYFMRTNGIPVCFPPLFVDALNHVYSLRESSLFPNQEDLHGAAVALVLRCKAFNSLEPFNDGLCLIPKVRLQDTYQLNVTELAEGLVVDQSTDRGKKCYQHISNARVPLLTFYGSHKLPFWWNDYSVITPFFLSICNVVFQSKRDLGGRDCLFMAQHAFADGYYDTALKWAEAAVERFIRKGGSYGAELENFRKEVKNFVDFASRVVNPTFIYCDKKEQL